MLCQLKDYLASNDCVRRTANDWEESAVSPFKAPALQKNLLCETEENYELYCLIL
jgi:hypothetical protein